LDAEQKRSQSEAQLNSVERVDNNTQSAALDAEAEEVAMQDTGLTSYKTSLNTRRSALLTQMSGLTPQHPTYKADAEELKQIDASLSDMTHTLKVRAATRLQDKLRAQVMRDRLVEGKIRSQVTDATSMANTAAPRMEEADSVSSAITRLEGRLSLVDERIANLELQNSSPGSVHLSQTAVPPAHADASKARKLALLLFPVCIFLGIFAAVARDLAEPHVWNGGDVSRLLGFEPVAVLPMRHLVADGFYQEQLFRLAGGMERAIQGSKVQTVLMAPVRSGTNTGEVLEQIARELSHLGLRIVVLDSQQGERALAYPAIHEVGEDAHQRPVELALAPSKKGRLGAVLDATTEFSEEADAVLLEGAPLLLSAESEYLARMVDATVLVAVAGETKRHDLLRAVRLLERIRAGSVAVVVAESDLKHADAAYQADAKAYGDTSAWQRSSYDSMKRPATGEYISTDMNPRHLEPEVMEYTRMVVPNNYREPTRYDTDRVQPSAESDVRVLLEKRGLLEKRTLTDRRGLPDRRVRQIAVLFDRRVQPDRRVQQRRLLQDNSEPQSISSYERRQVPFTHEQPAQDPKIILSGNEWERNVLPERRTLEVASNTPKIIPPLADDAEVLDTRWVNPPSHKVEIHPFTRIKGSDIRLSDDLPPAENAWMRQEKKVKESNTEVRSSQPREKFRQEPFVESMAAFPFEELIYRETSEEPGQHIASPALQGMTEKEVAKPTATAHEALERGKLLSWLSDNTESSLKNDTQYGNTSSGLPLLGVKKPKDARN